MFFKSLASHIALLPQALFLLLFAAPVMPAERLLLANAPTLLTGLITLAQSQGYPAAEGLEVEEKRFPTGDEALKAVIAGEAEVAAVAETAFTFNALAHPELKIFAGIGNWDNEVKLLARADSGIESPKDLKGKRVGTQGRLSTHFFLDQVLMKYGMTEADIQPIFRKAPELPDLLASGEVDAIAMREPFLSQATGKLEGKVRLFEEPGVYQKSFELVATEQFLRDHPKRVQALLRALLKAEEFLRNERERAVAILVEQLKLAPADPAFREARLRLSLDNKLLYTIELVADWARRAKLVQFGRDLNFLDLFAPEPLKAVKPLGVTLVK